MAFLCLVCLTGAIAVAARRDPWVMADAKVELDVTKFSQIARTPDQVSWRLSEDPSVLRVMIWNTKGELQYPKPGRMVPLSFEFSADTTLRLTALQMNVDSAEWISSDMSDNELLHCRAKPAMCLVYDRVRLEEHLRLKSGDLTSVDRSRETSVALAMFGLLFAGVGTRLRQRKVSKEVPTFKIVPERYLAIRGSLEIPLTPRDLKLLNLLSEREGNVVTKDELYDAAWGREYMPNSRALDQHIITLRRKLDPRKSLPALIETVRGVGYRLQK
ncbi:MAG: winged helix-turn-helix domain-containing protein [Paracoccaceae bacterium]